MPVASQATEARRQRGAAIADLFRIEKKGNRWMVPSQYGRTKHAVCLDFDRPTCTCDDFAGRGEPCKHIFAARIAAGLDVGSLHDGTTPPPAASLPVPEIIRRTCAERPTYRQDWPAYNLAQTREKAHFQALLADLCRGVPELPRKPGPGRKPATIADLVFAAVFKVFSTFSGRRFQTDLDNAHAKGYLSRALRYNTVFDGFDRPEMAPILTDLVAKSSQPLAAIETSFAIDSSGFGTSRFARWYDEKYGTIRQECEWIKCHLMCGVKTNIVSAVDIDGTMATDNSRFAPLLAATARNFTVREVSADAAFSTYASAEEAARIGATPFIAFKANATAEKGGAFQAMFHFYSLRRDEFLKHYHKRSNVESTFSMIKAKFGDSLRSKTKTAMINEALCKILGHNLCCLIQSHYELGIAPLFWGSEAESAPEVEAMPVEAFAWV